MSNILADDSGAGLAASFEAAANDPDGFDFAFKVEREATGFANFGFDPTKAAEMRAADPSNRIDDDEFDDEYEDYNSDEADEIQAGQDAWDNRRNYY